MRSSRILFVTPYPGYMRFYDSTIAYLEREGHEVTLAFHEPGEQVEGLVAAENLAASVLDAEVPRWPRGWRSVIRSIRLTGDFMRYLHPDYRDAYYLRARAKRARPRRIMQYRTIGRRRLAAILWVLAKLENAIPADPYVEYLRDADPDVLVVTSLAGRLSVDTDLVKAAHALRIPAVFAVASWDNLTTRGIVRVLPDRVAVWNEPQKREAVEHHRIPPGDVVVTGAQSFDHWFDRDPASDRATFAAEVGLAGDRPFVLYVASSATIAPGEVEVAWVRKWIEAVRTAPDPAVRELGVLVRPHPFFARHWSDASLDDLGDAVVWPRGGSNPVAASDRADYYDSLYHSAAVVGINTTAMLEAAIVGRPVLTVRAQDFRHSQEGTLHFKHLLPSAGGATLSSGSLSEHVRQLSAVLAEPEAVQRDLEAFVRSFVRPHGLEEPAVPRLAQVIAEAASIEPRRAAWTSARWLPGRAAFHLVTQLLVSDAPGRRRLQRAFARTWKRRVRQPARRVRKLARQVTRVVASPRT